MALAALALVSLLIADAAQAGRTHASTSRGVRVAPRSTPSSTAASHFAWVLPLFGAPSKPPQDTSAKQELLDAIAPLQRGLAASDEDVAAVETLAQRLEKINPNPKSLASPFINGRWELLYTTSNSILAKGKPRFLRPNGPIYQDIDALGLRAKNAQRVRPIPFVKIPYSVRAALTPTSASAVDVQFLEFRVGPVKIKAPETAKGALDTTYLDEDLRVSRGDKGNLFVLMKAVGQEPDFS